MNRRRDETSSQDLAAPLRVGVLADTHGLLRPEVLERLAGCDVLLHAGDVGDPEVLSQLTTVAPVWAVRGNVDGGALAALPAFLAGWLGGAGGVEVQAAAAAGGVPRAVERSADGPSGAPPSAAAGRAAGNVIEAGLPFRMTHCREDVAPGWTNEARLIVFGHSHRPELAWQAGCLLLNPGSCGPRRFRLPLTVAVLTVHGDRLVPEILAVE